MEELKIKEELEPVILRYFDPKTLYKFNLYFKVFGTTVEPISERFQ